MADSTFTFRLVTPQRLVLETPVVSLQAPGSEGYLGILAHHAPLITMLKPGRLDVKEPGGQAASYAVSGGFLEVSNNRATVLADAAERMDQIDRGRAEAALKRAEDRLKAAAPDIDVMRAQAALERARNRLAIPKG